MEVISGEKIVKSYGTHDPQMASYCSRLILLKDGVILEDLEKNRNQESFYQEILGKMKEL